MSRASSRRGLLVMALLLVVLLVAVDLARPGSVLRGAWEAVSRPEGTPAERLLRQLRGR